MKTPQLVKIDWQKVFYFSFITETHNHKQRRVVPLNRLRKCITPMKTKKDNLYYNVLRECLAIERGLHKITDIVKKGLQDVTNR
jgi:hypothetical protein